MAERRKEGEPCPLPNIPSADLEACVSCRYFRGASFDGTSKHILCNWPRSGSEVDPNPPSYGPPLGDCIPDAFRKAFDD